MAFMSILKRFVSSAVGDDSHIEDLRKKALSYQTAEEERVTAHMQGMMLHNDDSYISGTKLFNCISLQKAQTTLDKKILQIGGVQIPEKLEQRSFLLAGAQGTGKSVALCRIYDTIRARGQKAVVYDPTGEFIEKYYREGKDVIFNPLDSRTVTWNLYKDYDEASYANIANLIPDGEGEAQIWADSAKVLMTILLEEANSIDELIFMINTSTDAALKKIMAIGGQAGKIGAPATFQSVRFNVSNYCDSLQLQKNVIKGSAEGFSVEEYLNDEASDAWVFLPITPSHKKLLSPLISLFFDTLVSKSRELSVNRSRRIWMCIDELPSLPRLPSLTPAMAEGRKFGLIVVIGVQAKSMLESTYGKNDADTIWGLFATRLYLMTLEASAAESMSNEIGQVKVLRRKVNISSQEITYEQMMRGSTGQSISTSNEIVQIDAVMPSEIMGLKERRGYLILSGDSENDKEVAYVGLSYEGLTPSQSIPSFCKGVIRNRKMMMDSVAQINPKMHQAYLDSISKLIEPSA